MAKRVVDKQQIFKGKPLKVKLLVKKYNNKESEIEENGNTVLVSDLPEGLTENNIHTHFQKENGGGDVQEVILFPGNKQALVVFEDPEGERLYNFPSCSLYS